MKSSYYKTLEILTDFDHQAEVKWSQISILLLPDVNLKGAAH
jgi:hypothetical protein